jgi:hypothetical protein
MAKKKDSKSHPKVSRSRLAEQYMLKMKERSDMSKKRQAESLEQVKVTYTDMLKIETERLKNKNLSDADKAAIQKDIDRLQKKLDRLEK